MIVCKISTFFYECAFYAKKINCFDFCTVYNSFSVLIVYFGVKLLIKLLKRSIKAFIFLLLWRNKHF